MAPKRIRTSNPSTSFVPPPPHTTPKYPTYLFTSQDNVEKFLRILEYTVVKERFFDVTMISGYEELSLMLEARGCTYLNGLIKEANQSIGFELYASFANWDLKDYMSYVRGKFTDYSPRIIDTLLYLQDPPRCSIQNKRSYPLYDKMS